MKKICKSIQNIALTVFVASVVVAFFAPAAMYVAAASMLVLAFAAIAEPEETKAVCPTIFTKEYHDHYYNAA